MFKRILKRFPKAILIIIISIYFSLAIGIGATTGLVVAFSQNSPNFSPAELRSTLPSTIKDNQGNLITTLDREHRREEVSIDEISQEAINAFIAVEDKRFYDHFGIDLKGIFRAAINNFNKTGNPFRGSEGGSTITQQLVKNTLLTPDNLLERKIKEARIAIQLENSYSKSQILELYLNYATYFGHNNYGIEAASNFYFDKSAENLNAEEAALLAGIIRRPGELSPHNNTREAKARQVVVLNTMREQGYISLDKHRKAVDRELDELLAPIPEKKSNNPYFVDYVINEEAKTIINEIIESAENMPGEVPEDIKDPEELLYYHGLTIHTTMDREIQNQAESIIEDPDNYPESWKDENGVVQPQGGASYI